MVDGRVVEDPVAAIGSLKLNSDKLVLYGYTGDRVGLLGGKGRSSVGKVGEWYVESRYLQDCSPGYVD
jgi:hypothetical protein